MAGRRLLNIGCHDDEVAELARDAREKRQPGAVNSIVIREKEAHQSLVRATLIHNPTAGDERPTAQDLQEMLAAAGFQVRYQSSKKDWKKALQWKADLVVAAGGDGTVAKVFRAMSGRDTPIALLPIGTANNIARTLRILGNAHEIIDGWRTGEPRPFDLATVKSDEGELTFVEAAGGGLFADSIDQGAHVETGVGLTGNEIDRALAHLRDVIARARASDWRVTVDGRDASGRYLAVETMNIRHAGPSVPIAPKADPHDGWLDVVLIADGDRQALLEYVDQRLAQHEVPLPKLTVLRGRRIVVSSDSGTMRIDDEVADGGREWTIDIRPGAIRVY